MSNMDRNFAFILFALIIWLYLSKDDNPKKSGYELRLRINQADDNEYESRMYDGKFLIKFYNFNLEEKILNLKNNFFFFEFHKCSYSVQTKLIIFHAL